MRNKCLLSALSLVLTLTACGDGGRSNANSTASSDNVASPASGTTEGSNTVASDTAAIPDTAATSDTAAIPDTAANSDTAASGTAAASDTAASDTAASDTPATPGSTPYNTQDISVTNATLPAALAALDAALPAEPSMPATVCSTLSANLSSAQFALPNATDPTVDNQAAVTLKATNSNPDTARIQAAMTTCAPGQAVKLVASGTNNAFLSAPLTLPTGVTLWVDSGVTLYASRNPLDYDKGLGSANACGDATATTTGTACKALMTVAAGANGSGVVGLGTIDGRGGSALTGGPKAGIMTWWDVSLLNKVSGYSQNNPMLLDLTQGGSNFTLYKIALLNSPYFHVKINSYNGVTAWGVQILTPSLAYSVPNYACTTLPSTTTAATTPGRCYTPDYAKNTDGIDPGGSSNVTVAYSYISGGDDNVAVTASNKSNCPTPGANGYCASTNTLIAHNHFYYGHGMSVGSGSQGGVSNLFVWDLSINGEGSTNGAGLRIKGSPGTGGSVSATYAAVCIANEKQPIVVDPFYASNTGTTLLPNFNNISYVGIHAVKLAGAKYPGSSNWSNVINGLSVSPVTNLMLDNVYFDTVAAWANSGKPPSGFTGSPNYVGFNIGSGSTNFPIPTSGPGVRVTGITGTATSSNALDCTNAFPAFSSVNPNAPI